MGTLGGYLAASLLVTPIVLVTSRRHFAEVPRHWKAFVSFGLFAALTTVSQGTAYLMTLSSYVEAVKQVEILFAMAHRGGRLRGEAEGPGHRARGAGDAGGGGLAVARELDFRSLAVAGAHHGLDPARTFQSPTTSIQRGARRRHEVVRGCGWSPSSWKAPLVAIGPDVELDGLQLDQVLVRDVPNAEGREVGLARHAGRGR